MANFKAPMWSSWKQGWKKVHSPLSGDSPWFGNLKAEKTMYSASFPPNTQWGDRTTMDRGPTEDCLKEGHGEEKRKSTKQSLVLRKSEIMQGKCWHDSLSGRACDLVRSCLPWKWPLWCLGSVFETSVLPSHRLKRLILQKCFMLAVEQMPQSASCPRKPGGQSSFCIWIISMPFSPCLLPVKLPWKPCRRLCTWFNFNPFEKKDKLTILS